MNEEILDWQDGIARVLNKRELYVRLLGKFIEGERDAAARVEQALKNGNAEEARHMIHTTKGAAANLGAKALAAAALELEMALKAGANADSALGRFTSVHMDTLVSMQAFMAQ